MTDELLTVQEVAERLKVNPQTVRNWIDRDELQATRVGARRVRITESELIRFLNLKEESAASATARPGPVRPRRATARDMDAVDKIIEAMLATAASLPLGSVIGRELAESAGRLQVARRQPGAGDTKHLQDRSDITSST